MNDEVNNCKKKIKMLTVSFENEIASHELPYFRGVVIQIAGRNHELFHNHLKNDTFRYAYPLIQYKRKGKKPCLVSIEAGIDSCYHFFEKHQEGVLLKDRPYELIVENINFESFTVAVSHTPKTYKLQSWLPLNQNNYKNYKALVHASEQKAFLERIIVGNILSFAKGIDWYIQEKVVVDIKKIIKERTVVIKGVKRIAFDLAFMSNVSIPDFISLGKNASMGFGTIEKINSKKLILK